MADFDLAGAITDAATQNGVDPNLALAIAQHGEGYGKFPTMGATSPKGARGTFQLMPTTAASLKYGAVDPNDPQGNILGGVRYIRELQDQFGADRPDLIAAGYNAGPGAVTKYGGVPPYHETQGYVQRVTGALSGGQTAADAPLPSPADVLGGYQDTKAAATPSGAPQAAADGSGDLPSPDEVMKGYAGAQPSITGQPNAPLPTTSTGIPGNRTVDQVSPGVWKDPTTGHMIVPGDAPGYYRDATTGAAFEDTSLMKPGQVTAGGLAGQAARGAVETLKGTGEQVLNTVNPTGNVLGAFADQADNLGNLISVAAGNDKAPAYQNPAGIAIGDLSGQHITAPTDVSTWLDQAPTNAAERTARTVGQYAPGALFGPEGDVGLVTQGLRRAANVVVPAATSEVVGDTVHAFGASPQVEQGARFVGGLVGGVAAGAGPNAFATGARAAADFTGNAFGPFVASVSEGAAAKQAAAKLVASASDPAALRASVESGAQETVPGSRPTTFQQSGDLGVGAAEKGFSNTAEGKTALTARAEAQNAARATALGNIQSGADPAAVSDFVTARLNEIDTKTQAAVDQATQAAQAKAASLGGSAPEASGAALRTAIADAQEAGRKQVSELYRAIDPDGKLTGNVTATKTAAQGLLAEMQPTSAPMGADEAHAFTAASEMPDVAPLRTLTELRSNVGAQMATELRTKGATPAYARLSRLYGAIQENLATTIADKVASDERAVQSGALPANESAAAQLARVQAEVAREGLALSYGGRSGSVPAGKLPRGGPSADAGGVRASVPGGGQPVDAPRGPGVQGQGAGGAVAQPTVDQAALDQLNVGSAAVKAHHQIYDAKPVATILKTNGRQGAFATPDSAVGQTVWTGKPGELEAVQAAVKAGGPTAETAIADHAAADLRASATNPDGSIDPKRFAAWQARHAGGLKALPPEVRAGFADAAAAGKTLGDAAVARTEAMKAAQQGAAAKLIGLNDPDAVTRTVGAIFGKATAADDMRALVQTVGSDPAAKAGLRQAVADHILSKVFSNTEAGTSGVNTIKADGFQTFLKANRAALKQVFTSDEMQTLQNIADDIHRSARSANALKTAGSDTELNRSLAGTSKMTSLLGHYMVTAAGGLVGFALHGIEGLGEGGLVGELAQRFRQAGVDRVQTLFHQAILDPDVAKALLAKLPSNAKPNSPAFTQAKARLLRALAQSTGVSVVANSAPPKPTAEPTYTPRRHMTLNAFTAAAQ